MIVAFLGEHRKERGGQPIYKVLPIAPSTYYNHLARQSDPARLSKRARWDTELRPEIARVFNDNFGGNGVRKAWRQVERKGFGVSRCVVPKLMRSMGL